MEQSEIRLRQRVERCRAGKPERQHAIAQKNDLGRRIQRRHFTVLLHRITSRSAPATPVSAACKSGSLHAIAGQTSGAGITVFAVYLFRAFFACVAPVD